MRVTNVGIFSSNARNANGGAINPEDIKKGVTIAGVTGKLEESFSVKLLVSKKSEQPHKTTIISNIYLFIIF